MFLFKKKLKKTFLLKSNGELFGLFVVLALQVNDCDCSLELVSKDNVRFRGVFRAMSDIFGGAFHKNS